MPNRTRVASHVNPMRKSSKRVSDDETPHPYQIYRGRTWVGTVPGVSREDAIKHYKKIVPAAKLWILEAHLAARGT